MAHLGAKVAEFLSQFLHLPYLLPHQCRVLLLHRRNHLHHGHVALLKLLHHLTDRDYRTGQ